jgi:hypothetical protein
MVAIDLIGAIHARVDLVGEALIGLLDGRHRVEREVKSGNASGIKPGALDCRS